MILNNKPYCDCVFVCVFRKDVQWLEPVPRVPLGAHKLWVGGTGSHPPGELQRSLKGKAQTSYLGPRWSHSVYLKGIGKPTVVKRIIVSNERMRGWCAKCCLWSCAVTVLTRHTSWHVTLPLCPAISANRSAESKACGVLCGALWELGRGWNTPSPLRHAVLHLRRHPLLACQDSEYSPLHPFHTDITDNNHSHQQGTPNHTCLSVCFFFRSPSPPFSSVAMTRSSTTLTAPSLALHALGGTVREIPLMLRWELIEKGKDCDFIQCIL